MSFINQWYPLMLSQDLRRGQLEAVRLLNEPLVVYRGMDDKVGVLQDRCPHRSTPLSLGRVVGSSLECRYHGWRFAADGSCQAIPSNAEQEAKPPRCAAASKLVQEAYGLIWVFANSNDAAAGAPIIPELSGDCFATTTKFWRFMVAFDLSMPHELMVENLLDPAHLPFAHHGTLSKRSKACPIDFSAELTESGCHGIAYLRSADKTREQSFNFIAPCTVRLDIPFARQRSMRQVHYCVPVSPHSMRLISVFYYFGMSWLGMVPAMRYINKYYAKRIVQQDVAMLQGQYANLQQGAKAWNQAVAADKLGVLYRRWFTENAPVYDFSGF